MVKTKTEPKPETSLQSKFQALAHELRGRVLERDEVVTGAMIAILAQVNMFLLGKPGTAKTFLVKLLAKAIKGTEYFYYLLRKDSKFEEIFGAMKLSVLDQDRFMYNPERHLPVAHFPFMDEIFKATSVLNSLLSALNEHIWVNDGQELPIAMQSCFSASNELPEDSSLDALYDRFVLRYQVNYITDESNFRSMIRDRIHRRMTGIKNDAPLQHTVTLEELTEAQYAVSQVNCDKVEDIEAGLKAKFAQAGLEFSDRKWNSIVEILQASAWLSGRSAVEYADVEVLKAVFWDRPEQIREVNKIILSFSNPDLQAALSILDEAQSVAEQAIKTALDLRARGQKAYQVGGEANEKLNELKERLGRLQPSTKRDDILSQIKTLGKDVQSKCLGI